MQNFKICKPKHKNGNSEFYCGKEKSIEEFTVDPRKTGGYTNQCKDCYNKRSNLKCNDRAQKFTEEYYENTKYLTQICSGSEFTCGKEKILDEFPKRKSGKNGRSKQCKKCKSEQGKYYYEANKKIISEQHKEYRKENKTQIQQIHNQYKRERRKLDSIFKFREVISCQARRGFKDRDIIKNNKSFWSNISYTPGEGCYYIESLWDPWMTWDNFGPIKKDFSPDDVSTWTWQIDHIIPQSSFDFKDFDDEFKKCWSLENLQPLRSDFNLKKGNKEWPDFKQLKEYQIYLIMLKSLYNL